MRSCFRMLKVGSLLRTEILVQCMSSVGVCSVSVGLLRLCAMQK
jgi:hypothetical protein